MKSGIKLTGMFRIRIGEEENGEQKIVGDSGWVENTVTNLGFAYFIIGCFAPDTDNSIRPTHFALATGTDVIASDATSLTGETSTRLEITGNTSTILSRTYQATGSWSSDSSPDANIGSIGLFGVSTASAGTIMAGQTFAESSWGSNQAVSATYQLQFQSTT